MLFALTIVNAPSGVAREPTVPRMLISPVPAVNVIGCGPLIVLAAEKLIVPPPKLESMDVGAVRVTGLVPVKLMPALAAVKFVVTTDTASRMFPEPFWVKIPLEVNVFPAVVVSVPLLLIERGPLPVVVTFCKKVKADPVKLTPPTPLVLKFP